MATLIACYFPRIGRRNDKNQLVPGWAVSRAFPDDQAERVPCNQCCGCNLERARQMMVRTMHEQHTPALNLPRKSCFITLTYNDEHIDPNHSLNREDWINFAKRWRHKHGPFRYLMCGEYGELGRPHFHAAIIGENFKDDRYEHRHNKPETVYRSSTLESLWSDSDNNPIGFAELGSLTPESAGYVARYILKKVTGKEADNYYEGRTPPFQSVSRRPGWGSAWLTKYGHDIYARDEIILNGHRTGPIQYYDRLINKLDPDSMASLKAKRRLQALKHTSNNTPERLAVRHEFKQQQLTRLKRDL